ncbi:hypothetical protein C8R43DRAFT_421192 [Mycena crocata]|nr:hypothetical protein C8R43DRAFT_421192 [Mycena crocata]
MKNFFQRKQDNQPKPTRSNTPGAYKVWLPPPDAASRTAAAGPSTWIPTSGQSTARKGDETHRSSSRAPRADVPTYNYGTVPNVTGFYSNNPSQSVPVQPFPAHYYPSPVPRPPGGLERPDSRLGYVPYPYQPQSFAAAPVPSQPPTLRKREAKTRNAVDGHVAPPAPAAGRPSSSRRQSEKDEVRAPRQPSPSIREYKREDVEVKKSKHRTREPSETRKRRDSQAGDLYEKYRDKSSRKESRRDGKSRTDPRVEEGDSSDSSIQRPSSSTGHRRRRTTEEGKPVLMVYLFCCFRLAIHNVIDEQGLCTLVCWAKNCISYATYCRL